MSLTDKERDHLQNLLGPSYSADRYAKNWGGYEGALESLPTSKPAKKKTTKKKAAKK